MALSIYKSSAGSGKTYTLAKEYLKLLLQNPLQHPNILAVTFTNRATQEMKERIIKFLINLSKNEDEGLMQQLKNETGYTFDHIKGNAKKALQQILHNYGDFTIVTIDSFFNRLIKSFAHELKLPLRMEVQLDSDEALEDAYDRLMLQLGIDQDLAKYITNYMFHKLDNDKGWYVEREIKDLGKQLFRESFDPVFKSLDKVEFAKIKGLIEETNAYLNRINGQIKDLGNEWFEHLDSYGLEVKDLAGKERGIGNFGTHLLNVNIKKLTEPGVTLPKALDDPTKWHTKTSKLAESIQQCAIEHLIPIASNALQIWQDVKAEYSIRLMLFKNLHALGLLKNINEQLKAFRDENDRILISDQNRLINEIISQSNVPFLYEKTGAKYRHFLLDEFQDTSALQWVNFRPLLENALAEGGKVLVVGDGKQSIYRWRGGKMELLLKDISEDLALFIDKGSIKNLDANYRSHKEIIEFNNQFFGEIAKAAAGKLEKEKSHLAELAFADVAQKTTTQTKDGGYVEMHFIDDEKEEYEDEKGKTKKRVTEKAKILTDEKLLETVLNLKKEGYQWRDLACLVFSNSQGARVAELLSSNNIPVQSSDSLLLKNAASVRLLISLLRHLQNPEDALRRGEVTLMLAQVGSLEFRVSSPKSNVQELKSSAVENQKSASRLSEAETELHTKLLKAKESTEAFYQLLPSELLNVLKKSSGNMLHLVQMLISALELENQAPEYLQRFTEIIYNYEVKNESHLGEFLAWWDETSNKHSIQTPENENAVVVLTIHRAKGLQYPVVLMPYAKRSIETKHSEILWLKNQSIKADWLDFLPLNYNKTLLETPYAQIFESEKEMAMVDALNMLYVAFTRPEERLYVFANHKEPNLPSTASFLHGFLESHTQLKEHLSGDLFEFGTKKNPNTGPIEAQDAIPSLVKTNTQPPLLRKPRLQIADLRAGNVKPFQKGILLHELLAKVNHKNDIPKCLQMAVSDGLINETEMDIWKEKLEEVLDNPQIKEWTETAIEQLNEQEFLTPNGTLRPDKIYVLPHRIIVVDYKTGSPKPEHEEQVLEYLSVVSGLEFHVQSPGSDVQGLMSKSQPDLFSQEQLETGNKELEAYLLYTQTNQLIKVN